MKTMLDIKNWVTDEAPNALNDIHQSDANIAIWRRSIKPLSNEVSSLIAKSIECKSSGHIDTIRHEITNAIGQSEHPHIIEDIIYLLDLFGEVTGSNNLRLLLATVNTNMCRKFHTDLNDLRMLCTYSGPGTLWLKEENINRSTQDITAIREEEIQQVATGDIAILKGAIYPNVQNAVVHRSPTIEETGEKRLLLRIDTNANQKLWR